MAPADVPWGNIFKMTEERRGGAALSQKLYRVLRVGETPLSLRCPPAKYESMTEDELRGPMIHAIAWGNDPARPSEFLHCTRSLARAKVVWSERRALYSTTVVRFPRDAVPEALVFDFSHPNRRREAVLGEKRGDTQWVEESLQRIRAYVSKEVVLLRRPASERVEWWGIHSCSWRLAREWEAERSSASPAASGAEARSRLEV